MTNDNNLLVADSIVKIYDGNNQVLTDINLEVAKGEFVTIMGSSGSGKTTLLNSLSMIDPPTEGKVYFEGTDLTSLSDNQLADFRAEHISYVFQDYNLISSMTVYENIILPLQIRGEKIKGVETEVSKIMERLNIGQYKGSFPDQLSGGQQQRVATVRAIVSRTELLIADEPTGALDSANSTNLMEFFEELNNEYKTTIVMVTHDPLAAQYSNRVIFLKDGMIEGVLKRTTDQSRKEYLDLIYSKVSEV